MIPKRDVQVVSYRQSDMHHSFVYSRDHKALLRSTGHLFRDGRWTGADDDFFTFYCEEPPSLGKPFNFIFPSYERDAVGDFPGPPTNGQFRVCITRGFDSSVYYGSSADVQLPPVVESDFGDLVLGLNARGTNFIVKNRPGNPVLSAGQFLAELRELPQIPHFLRSGAKRFKDLGSEYLNVEFGWKPFVKDVVALFNGQQRIQAALKKLVKDNGLSVKRRSKKEFVLDGPVVVCEGSLSKPFAHLGDVSIGGNTELDGYYVGGPSGCADLDLYSFTGQCDYKFQRTVTTMSWQCGTFRYYVPDIGSDRWTERAKIALSGSNLTPSLLYEVVPWTWLIDWFANVGDIVSNLSSNAVDNETLTNAYSMESQETLFEVYVSTSWDELETFPFGSHFFVPSGSASPYYFRKEGYKARHQASPYGFGIPPESFTARQWAILAALGLTRSGDRRSINQV